MFSFRILTKLCLLGVLAIGLMIALSAMNGLVSERQGRQRDVEQEIAGSYAGEQTLVGPLLWITLEDRWMAKEYSRELSRNVDVEKRAQRVVQIYPDWLRLDTSISVDERKRGIFKARVFQSKGGLTGSFRLPPSTTWNTRPHATTRITSTKMILGIEDPRGLSTVPTMKWGEHTLDWSPGTGTSLHGIQADVDMPEVETPIEIPFSVELEVHGMGGFFLVPVAAENQMRITCEWPHPSFTGDFLPMTREISDEGFTAEWRVNALATRAREGIGQGQQIHGLQSLGVRLIDPITPYPLTDRALKYGFLFVGITFASFFLYEMIRRLRIHPIQYGFVGFAQAVFFLLLLSLSEHVRFGLAYGIAMSATCLLLAIYIGSILGGLMRGVGFGALLLLLYGALYGLLQSEDHALLAGSVLLFGLMAAVMVLTRNINWYELMGSGEGRKTPPPPPVPNMPETPA